MINLKDYLASLVIGVNQARILADFESARIAKIYAQDDILKTFPVPHFRLPDVELNIPIAIDQLEQELVKDYQPIDNLKFNAATYQIIKDYYKVDAFENTTSKKIRKLIARESNVLEKNLKKENKASQFLKEFSSKIAISSLSLIKETSKENEKKSRKEKATFKTISTEELDRSLNKRLEMLIKPLEFKNDISNSKVIVEANKLKEINPNSIINIKMKLTEEGMEWHKIENADGENSMKLLPE